MKPSNCCFPAVFCLCALCGLASTAAAAEQDAKIQSTVKAKDSIFEKHFEAADARHATMLVGIASSTEKIRPRGTPYEPQCDGEINLSLARNEEEAIQVLVKPRAGFLEGVTVRPNGNLHGPGETVLAASLVIECEALYAYEPLQTLW